MPGALDDAAVTEALNLHKIKNRQWAIFKTSAIKGEGLFEGLDWYELDSHVTVKHNGCSLLAQHLELGHGNTDLNCILYEGNRVHRADDSRVQLSCINQL